LSSFALNISFFVFCPSHHLTVILFRWSNRFTLIFLFYIVHIGIKFLLVFFILFFLPLFLYFFVFLFFFFLLFYDSVTSHINRIIADLRYDGSRMRIYQWTIFYWIDFFFLKLLFSSFNFSFFLCLKLLNSVIKTWRFFQLRNRFFRRYFLQCFLQFHC